MKIKNVDRFQLPELPEHTNFGNPGEPSLPGRYQFVLLRNGQSIESIKVSPGMSTLIPDIVNPYPVQYPVPDKGIDPKTMKPYPVEIIFAPLKKEFRESKERFPEELVKVERYETYGPLRFAVLKVNPLQYVGAEDTYYFYPHLTYDINFTNSEYKISGSKNRQIKLTQTWTEILHMLVKSQQVLLQRDLDFAFQEDVMFQEEITYVVITDNNEWNGLQKGNAIAGDMIAEFERLAKWKNEKGVRTRVVTISEIVDKQFGDMTNGNARDLAEILRNFIKYIYNEWHTYYVLMAGDINIVPMRFMGVPYDNIEASILSPLPQKKYFKVNSNTIKLHNAEGEWNTSMPLCLFKSGQRIPYNQHANDTTLGWFYTTEQDFNTNTSGFTRSNTETKFIIVTALDIPEGEAFYWVKDDNHIPSDFYYASILGDGYSQPGKHDFDTLDNEVYGQYHDSIYTLDDVDFGVDLTVSRVLVRNASEAKSFVDKTLVYEKLKDSSGLNIDFTYLRKILYGSTYWGSATRLG